MKVFGKLFLVFVIIITMFIGLNIYSIIKTNHIKDNGEKIYEQGVEPSKLLIELGRLAENTRVQMVTALAFKNVEATKAALSNLDAMNSLQQQLDEKNISPEKQQALLKFNETWNLFDERVRANEQLMVQGKWEEATDGIKAGKTLFEDSMLAFDTLTAVNASDAEAVAAQSDTEYKTTFTLFVVLSSIILCIALGTAYVFARNLTKRLRQLARQTTLLANGDLTADLIPITANDEISQTAEGINKMQQSLTSIVTEANDTSQQVSASAEELSATTEENLNAAESIANMSQNSYESASAQQQSVEEITKSLKDMTGNVNRILENGKQLHHLSNETFSKTQLGSTTVENVNAQIQSIADSSVETERSVQSLNAKSQQIGSIVNMITQIAEQTNLLALNAAIEAARAGDSGKGFAVVADEVRKLAEQSRDSSEQIQQMINEVQHDITKVIGSIQEEVARVEVGLQKSAEVKEVFTEIESMVADVKDNSVDINESIDVISQLSLLISSKTNEVNDLAIKTLEAAEANNASSETQLGSIQEITSASESLASLSVQLQTVIGHFKL